MKLNLITKSDATKIIEELDHCIFCKESKCSIDHIPCRYGLTEINVPKLCPLRLGKITTTLSIIR